jgi:pantetheine-phosphate adenylyltransferase
MKIAIFAGTFDPFTIGHYDIASRASKLFDKVIVAVADNGTGKKCVASSEKRKEIAEASVSDLPNVSVEVFDGLLTDFAKKCGAKYLVRGVRNSVDYEYERGLFAVYKSLNEEIEAVYFITDDNVNAVSSTLVREILALNGNADKYICDMARRIVAESYR